MVRFPARSSPNVTTTPEGRSAPRPTTSQGPFHPRTRRSAFLLEYACAPPAPAASPTTAPQRPPTSRPFRKSGCCISSMAWRISSSFSVSTACWSRPSRWRRNASARGSSPMWTKVTVRRPLCSLIARLTLLITALWSLGSAAVMTRIEHGLVPGRALQSANAMFRASCMAHGPPGPLADTISIIDSLSFTCTYLSTGALPPGKQ
mmetsp:Transcript_66748/g.187994  ORF Transcript_66748/g.187994 Transcript_66748/m.187994 type:complete len:205 (-) Transcript_66748:185-799(-)